VFSLLRIEAMIMMRLALSEDSLASLRADDSRRTLTRLSLNLVPFARIASLWFHRCCQAVAVPPWSCTWDTSPQWCCSSQPLNRGAQLAFPAGPTYSASRFSSRAQPSQR
jgi:hypothetical protein